MKRVRHVNCSVRFCSTSALRHPERSYFKLPKDPALRALWLQKLHRTDFVDNSRVYVCRKHFPEEMMNFSNQRTQLLRKAVPTLFMGRGKTGAGSAYQEDATTSSAAGGTPLNKEHPLAKRIKYEDHIKGGDVDQELQGDFVEDLQAYLPEDLQKELEETVIADQMRIPFENQLLNKEESRTARFSHKFKMFALELYFGWPNAYKLLRSTFSLPKISCLFTSCVPTSTVISEGVMTALKIKASLMSVEQLDCVICVKLMSVTPEMYYDAENDKIFGFHEIDGVQTLVPARSILVIMVRGLFHNWKQTVSFSFLSNFHDTNNVKYFIDEIITRLCRLGLNIRVYLTDHDTDKLTGGMDRDVSVKMPFILVTKKIFYMYDPLHLMKNIRDSMLTNDINYNCGVIAQWKYLEECYEFDRQRQDFLRLAPKLTTDHMKLGNGQLNELQLTADVFSAETATAMSAYVDMKNMHSSVRRDTAQWITTMSRFLALLNFSTLHPPSDKSLVFSGETNQVEFLVGMLTTLLTMRLVPINTDNIKDKVTEPHSTGTYGVVPSFNHAFRVTINAFLLLYGQLKTEKRWLPIHGLSLDCIDDFFYKVKKKYGFVKPTTKQITECITKFPVCNIFRYSCSKKSNPNELEMFMAEAKIIPNVEEINETEMDEVRIDPCHEESAEFSAVQLSQDDGVEHLALYLLYKAYLRHSDCIHMHEYCCSDDATPGDDDGDGDGSHVGYKTKEGNVVDAVPRNFLEFIDILEIKFKDYFKENHLSRSISGLQSFMERVEFVMPCLCFPLDYVKLLYLRLRLYLVLKYNNEVLRKTAHYKNAYVQFVVNDL